MVDFATHHVFTGFSVDFAEDNEEALGQICFATQNTPGSLVNTGVRGIGFEMMILRKETEIL